jgi:hypothetical protein
VPLEYLDAWLALDAEDAAFKKLVVSTLRNLHTYIKNLKPEVTHNTHLYPWHLRKDMYKQERMTSND